MSRYFSYLNSAKEILSGYNGNEPFASFIKKYFSHHKKYGSKDRKQVTHLCYCYFRLGKSLNDAELEEKILAGLFLCSSQKNEILQQLKPAWNDLAEQGLEQKIVVLAHAIPGHEIFPFTLELSEGIEVEKFMFSHLVQPDLFLRLRPAKETQVKKKLQEAGISFYQVTDQCLALPNSSGIDKIIQLNKDAVVQDYNSQQVGEFFSLPVANGPLAVWDCCAASGGKSILLYDIDPTISLAVSDVRESILINLRKRFSEAGIKKYHSFTADLSKRLAKYELILFDLIICDAPCSGSGTWGRTPEQLCYFEQSRVDQYASLQKKIISTAISQLKPGGFFLYITCSVFKKENEEAVDYLKSIEYNLLRMEILTGYDKKADTLFAALFQKPS